MGMASRESYEEIVSERQRLLALLNSVPSPILALRNDGRVFLYNISAREMINTARNLSGRLLKDILPLNDENEQPIDLFELVQEQPITVERADLHYTPTNRPTIYLNVIIAPIHSVGADHRRWGGYTVVCRDITKEHEAVADKDEFISVISHELRTPLAIAEANLSTALVPTLSHMNAQAVEMVGQAHDNVLFLIELVKDLTALSRIEKGVTTSTDTAFDLNELAAEMERDYHSHAAKKGLMLTYTPGAKPRPVHTSRPELQEILQNLIVNAIKYTPTGSVDIRTSFSNVSAKVLIHDTGIGINKNDRNKIYGKFFRSNDARVQETDGAGLGLYISHKLAGHLGLKLSFISKANGGTTFTVAIPMKNQRKDVRDEGKVA